MPANHTNATLTVSVLYTVTFSTAMFYKVCAKIAILKRKKHEGHPVAFA